jgi:hypothetical protein
LRESYPVDAEENDEKPSRAGTRETASKRKLTGWVMRYKWGKVVPKYAPSILACLVLLGKKSP